MHRTWAAVLLTILAGCSEQKAYASRDRASDPVFFGLCGEQSTSEKTSTLNLSAATVLPAVTTEAAGTWPIRRIPYSFANDGSEGYFIRPEVRFLGESPIKNVLHATMRAQFGNDSWKDIIRGAFRKWQATSGLEFVETPDDGAAMGAGNERIRLFCWSIYDGPGGSLGWSLPYPDAVIWLDADEFWNKNDLLDRVVLHEIGHVLGFPHACPDGTRKVMQWSPLYHALHDDEIRKANLWYGDKNEPNDSRGAATVLAGSEAVGSVRKVDEAPDEDWFQFKSESAGTVTLVLRPEGGEYQVGTVARDKTCHEAHLVDTRKVMDLSMDILDGAGAILTQVKGGALGAEKKSGSLPVTAGATLYVRIYSAAPPAHDVQRYVLQIVR